jgi:hypothetical protein
VELGFEVRALHLQSLWSILLFALVNFGDGGVSRTICLGGLKL